MHVKPFPVAALREINRLAHKRQQEHDKRVIEKYERLVRYNRIRRMARELGILPAPPQPMEPET